LSTKTNAYFQQLLYGACSEALSSRSSVLLTCCGLIPSARTLSAVLGIGQIGSVNIVRHATTSGSSSMLNSEPKRQSASIVCKRQLGIAACWLKCIRSKSEHRRSTKSLERYKRGAYFLHFFWDSPKPASYGNLFQNCDGKCGAIWLFAAVGDEKTVVVGCFLCPSAGGVDKGESGQARRSPEGVAAATELLHHPHYCLT
jgi:hypothetical protein